jgi:hypothetical protein
MSTQPPPAPRPTRGSRGKGSDPLRSSIPGIALALASVLPAALSPSPGVQPPPSEVAAVSPAKAAAAHNAALAFKPGCPLPFEAIKTEGLVIDQKCSEDGNAGNDTGKRLESEAKNDFCVDGDPVAISYDDFKNLQAASDSISGLKNKLKSTREPLAGILSTPGRPKIGEGSVVQFVGFLLDAHFSNVGQGKGELVNCKLPDKEENDIHIELMIDPTDEDPCNSVTAEMSPHFRPETWSALPDAKVERPVRVTGHLFFDSSHQPCRGGKRPNPKRTSVWEIHPIYQFDVCKAKTLDACKAENDSQWIPLDEFISGDDETEP